MKSMLLAAAVGLLTSGAVEAGEPCCPAACRGKTCKVVIEMKTVTKTVWVVECEEFCPSLPQCDCRGDCGKTCGAACPATIPPKCCDVRVRKRLIKKEIECQVPVYKCVVVPCCDDCACGGGNAARPIEAQPTAVEAAPCPRAR